ncbi:MAG: phenylalanine--tRNA ligase subunit alpha, partial [Crocinitomicaceae bacterium]|nr:phenylalanine--tRNA ligase subunit alpha [Crocinitomicaceae bacterium]
MKEQIEAIKSEAFGVSIQNAAELEAYRIAYLGSKGKMKDLFGQLKSVPNEEKKEMGQLLNQLRQELEARFQEGQEALQSSSLKADAIDVSRPAEKSPMGSRHPLSLVRSEIVEIFARIGYNVSEGPEIEDDWHNFSSLNFPEEHPARDMQDTFFVEKDPDWALRTHTSSVQVRIMESQKPPIRTISPGRVFRNVAISARALCFFDHIEGIYIDKDVSFAVLKQTLLYFADEL